MKTLTFATQDQANLWEHEISGQISDGNWENTRPYDHYKPWCEAEVKVDLTNVGRNFYAKKDNYNLCSTELLSIIGRRMITIVKLGRAFGEKNIITLSYFFDDDGNFTGGPTYKGDYWDGIRARLAKFNANEVRDAVESQNYTMKDLKNDLHTMKVAMKTYR